MIYIFSTLNKLLQKVFIYIAIAPFILPFIVGYGFKRGVAKYEQWMQV